MGNRRHKELYPKWSFKRWHNPMPKWLRNLGHRKLRRKKILDPSVWKGQYKLIRERINNMWY